MGCQLATMLSGVFLLPNTVFKKASKIKDLSISVSVVLVILYYFLLLAPIAKSNASHHDVLKNELLLIHQDIQLLRNENRDQNSEIAILKEIVQSRDKTIHDAITKEMEIMMKQCLRDKYYWPGLDVRQKRPARLLPFHIFYNKTNDANVRKFYGPPKDCSELKLLGYTLNGFYLVKKGADKDETKLETVYCAFKQQDGKFNSSLLEKRVTQNLDLGVHSDARDHFHVKSNVTGGMKWNRDGTIQFNTIVLNLGEAFDKRTGIFTVPKSGIYQFIFRTFVSDENIESKMSVFPPIFIATFHLHHNSIIVGSTAFDSGRGNGVIEVTLQLNQSDKIYIRRGKINSGDKIDPQYTSFSGSLIG